MYFLNISKSSGVNSGYIHIYSYSIPRANLFCMLYLEEFFLFLNKFAFTYSENKMDSNCPINSVACFPQFRAAKSLKNPSKTTVIQML